MDDVKEALREFILATYLPGESRENLRDDTPLQTSGILDSLAALSVAGFVQERFGVDLDFRKPAWSDSTGFRISRRR